MTPHDELRALLELVPVPRGADHDTHEGDVLTLPSPRASYAGDRLEDLQVLAEAATHAHDVDDAWAGRRQPYDTRITCGLCGHEQPIVVPFVSATCRGCASAILPSRCTTCHHVSVVFSPEPRLSEATPCNCGSGVLRLLLRLPAPPATRVEQVLGPVGTTTPLGRRLGRGARGAGLALGLLGLALGGLVLRTQLSGDAASPAPAPVAVVAEAGGTPAELGRAAGADLAAAGRPINVFACRAAVPPALSATDDPARTAALQDFLTGCTGG